MKDNSQIPQDILTVIKDRQEAIQQAAQAKQEQEQAQLATLRSAGKEKFDIWLADVLTRIPDYMKPYRVEGGADDDLYERIGKNWGWTYFLPFSVPGLAMIRYRPDYNDWVSQVSWSYDEECPKLDFYNHSFNSKSLEDVLLRARAEYVKQKKDQAEWEVQQAERKASREKYEQEEAEREVRAWNASREETKREQDETQALVNALKDDPVALLLVQVFIRVREQNGNLVEQLNDAYESASYMEDRYAQRVADLRRQADDIERRAADEKSRLQDELDDAETKLKKAKQQVSW